MQVLIALVVVTLALWKVCLGFMTRSMPFSYSLMSQKACDHALLGGAMLEQRAAMIRLCTRFIGSHKD